MLSVRLDSPVPIGEQILAGVRALIALGSLNPGDELPPVRQLAGDLGVNLNTVARAYRALEADGLVRTARGRGTRVTAATERPTGSPAEVRARLESTLTAAVADMKLAALSRDDATQLIADLLNRYWPDANLKGEPS
ncbi:MAG: GntR family transcriptional regulator [Phycisphaerales bacterium]